MKLLLVASLALAAAGGIGCQAEPVDPARETDATTDRAAAAQDAGGEKRALFGELHVHSRNSFDAFTFGVRQPPADAYRYARGEEIDHISGERIRISRPLDFMAVTDHAEYMGLIPLLHEPGGPLAQTRLAREILSGDRKRAGMALREVIMTIGGNPPEPVPELNAPELRAGVWQQYVELADRFYEPGLFTTLVAFEWTASPDASNLHRNVLFRSNRVPPLPFSSFDSPRPEDLWAWLDEARERGIEGMAIPHNSNVSNGLMFPLEDSWGRPVDLAWAQQRIRNEPIVEMTQIKGTSETHPSLSPTDEWADFEILNTLLGGSGPSEPAGSYVRDAYLRGLRLEVELGSDPYRFGMIGATDSHNASVPAEEHNYTGKIGRADGTAEARLGGSLISPKNLRYGASGLAGVWAHENTREAVYDALARKESFATSGPRIALKLTANGRAMGSVLPPGTDEIELRIEALRDPESAPLQRLQVVKGWIENGEPRERVVDVACSDGARPSPETGRCPDNGATIDVRSCEIPEKRGDAQLVARWIDEGFDDEQPSFYYARVLENPTCRWSTWDALRNGWALPEDTPATIQERAWSSPVWYTPN